MKKLIITGGRSYDERKTMYRILDAISPFEIIQGGANGADRLAKDWAKDRGVPCTEYPADWDQHGKAAGPIRNRKMLVLNPDAWVIAFPGGRGTENCVKQALELKMTVYRVDSNG